MVNKNSYSTLFEQGESYDYHYAEGEPDSYETQSYLGGTKKRKVKKGIFGNIGANFRKNQAIRQKQRAADSKNSAAAIKAMSKTDKPISLTPLPKESKDKGMSMGAKIGIGVGVLAILGIGAYFVMKKK